MFTALKGSQFHFYSDLLVYDSAIKISFLLPMDVPQNFTLIGLAVLEQKTFEIVDDGRRWTTDGRTDDGLIGIL